MKKKVLFIVISAFVLSSCIPSLSNKGGSTNSEEYIKGAVVKGFPALPLYPKSQVVETIGLKGSYGGSFITNADAQKVVTFYNESLPKLGWETHARQQSPSNYIFEIKNSSLKGTVIVNTAADGKNTAITIATSPR